MPLAKSQLNFPNEPWISLLKKAYLLLDTIASDGFALHRWILGGGTVLMFYYAHRKSADIYSFPTAYNCLKSPLNIIQKGHLLLFKKTNYQ